MTLSVTHTFSNGTQADATQVNTNFNDIVTYVNTIESDINTKLPLTGGTMSGSIAMGNQKITGLANGTSTNEAVNYGQLLSVTADSVPIGGCLPYTGTTVPSASWVWADGSSLLQASYPILYALYGSRYGSAAAGYFKVPDLCGRMVIGSGSGAGLTVRTIGQSGGAETVTLTEGQIPGHAHNNAITTIIDPGHTHNGYYHTSQSGQTTFYGLNNYKASTTQFTSANPTLTTNTTGITAATAIPSSGIDGTSIDTMNPYFVLPYIIKAL